MRSIYESGLHHPFAAYVGALMLFWLVVRRLPFLLGFLVVFGVEIVADATVTGAWSPVASHSWLYQPLSIVFVVLGDLRYFLLADWYTRTSPSLPSALGRSLPLSLLVPVVTGVGALLVPTMQDARVLFLIYELMLLALVAVLQHFVYGRRSARDPQFVRRVSLFVMVQYATWALADIVILGGVEAGYLLRIAPNVLYYALFLPYVFWNAPDRELAR